MVGAASVTVDFLLTFFSACGVRTLTLGMDESLKANFSAFPKHFQSLGCVVSSSLGVRAVGPDPTSSDATLVLLAEKGVASLVRVTKDQWSYHEKRKMVRCGGIVIA